MFGAMNEKQSTGDLTAGATVFDMVDRLALLKEQEDDLRQRRWDIEARLAEELQFLKTLADAGKNSGSKTFKVEDGEGNTLKVKLAQNFTHRLDASALQDVLGHFEEARVEPPVRYKPEPIMSQVDALQAAHPQLWRAFQRALTSTPSKIGVTVVK